MSTGLTVKSFRELYGYSKKEQLLWNKFTRGLSLPNKKIFFSLFPIIKWLPNYHIRDWLISDLVSGFTVGMFQVPQGMAYAALAGVKPIYGLYTGFFPVLLYTIFGTSKHLSMGSYPLTSLMIGAHLESILPLPVAKDYHNSTNFTLILDEIYDQRILYANATTFFTAVFLIAFGIFRIGSLTRVFARPFQSGFIFAVAFLTILSVGKNLFGIQIPSYSGPLSTIWVFRDFFSTLFSANDEERLSIAGNVVTSIVTISFLVVIKILNKKYKKKYFRNIAIPGEAIVITVGTLLSYFLNLETQHYVDIVGPIPSGLPGIRFPRVELFESVFLLSFLVSVIGYSVVVSLAQTFAEKDGYTIEPNQELFAFGFGNLFGSFFSCIPGFSSMSRSCVQYESGGKTQIVGWVSSLIMLFILLYIGSFLQFLPKACLSSIVVVGVSGMLWNIGDLKRYWTHHKLDAITWLCTCLATLLLGLTLGMAFGVGVLFVCHLIRSSQVEPRRLARIGDTELYKEEGVYLKETLLGDNLTLVEFHGPLNFYNSSVLKNSLETLSGINPVLQSVIVQRQKKLSDEAKKESVSKTNSKYFREDGHDKEDVISVNHRHAIILDCSGISSIDSVGVDMLAKVISSYKRINVVFLLAACSDSLLRCLDDIDDVTELSYVTVDGAVKAMTKQDEIDLLHCEEQNQTIL